jgi:hypothetical protein
MRASPLEDLQDEEHLREVDDANEQTASLADEVIAMPRNK